MKRAYLIVEIADVRDEKAYAEYRARVSAGGRRGRALSRAGADRIGEGRWRPEEDRAGAFDSCTRPSGGAPRRNTRT